MTLRPSMVIVYEMVAGLIFALPRFRVCNTLKTQLLRLAGATVGDRVVFYPGVWIVPPTGLVLGDDVDLARGVIVTARAPVSIGARTLVGYRAQILGSNHRIPPNRARIFDAGHDGVGVRIGSDCWIGANAIVLPGVTIGDGTVVAAGAVVAKDLPSYAVAGGIPARVLKSR